ncbi:hypothetical protein SERLADRAFT_451655 [Serpula lacrymans var. lacrymans S7.9]|uniref:Conserved oligomeric Golgi complex subunit 4 n=1 Tax=Serpula lacrymans var. lacrymans (strain S7.9) TaxID=578457 RepID=F8P4U6_SERL9|nr:uncharacterized protein SERLADRAFT_451655 [Serpula lacrymans var. lacrymans S7.9]EGO21633.1 hypothetical protein SERLADRAFT_451655 [Serpula lacrymans var. lacrymans S7.9]
MSRTLGTAFLNHQVEQLEKSVTRGPPEPIKSSLVRLRTLAPLLTEPYNEALHLSNNVRLTAETAQRLSGRMSLLDEEMRRVTEATERVGQVLELKSCLTQLQSCILSQDWESATRHYSRAMSLPSHVINGAFAESVIPTSEHPLPPAQALQTAREQLLKTFQRHFEQASQSRDATATSRFFKLFPVIDCQAEGLQAYSSFVVKLIRVQPMVFDQTTSSHYFVAALTALFESIAMIVDQHQSVVEKYYGPGRMLVVLKSLLGECDCVVEEFIQGWKSNRYIKQKLADVSRSPLSTLNTSSQKQAFHQVSVEDEVIDPREIDKASTEIAGMAGRWSLFRRFLIEQLTDNSAIDEDRDEISVKTQSQVTSDGTEVIQATASDGIFNDLLTSSYIPLEIWYTRFAIHRAHQLSSTGVPPFPAGTTTPDDTFYILKVVFLRLLSTGSLGTIKRTTELLKDIIDRDYISAIKMKLDDVSRKAGTTVNGIRGDKTDREFRHSYATLLNDIDVSSLHVDRLTRDLLQDPTTLNSFLVSEKDTLKSTISGLDALTPKLRSSLRAGVEQLFNQFVRPKLRTLIPDVYKDMSYVLDDDGYTEAHDQDTVKKRFIRLWEGLTDGYKELLTDNNYRMLFGLALDVVLPVWERYVMTLRYSELGAICFDRDLRSVVAYLSSQSIFGDVREKFTRLQQISILLNLDSDESVEGFYNGSGILWAMSIQDSKNVVGLKLA